MSAEYRTPEEYAKLYADRNNETIEQAEGSIAVRVFKDYVKEREKHDYLDSSEKRPT